MPFIFKVPPPSLDPLINLLIHSNTTNGSTTFVDSSNKGLSPITNGTGTQHSSTAAKFGATSIRFAGTGHIRVPEQGGGIGGSGEFYLSNADFTIDCWVKADSVAPNAQVIAAQGLGSTTDAITAFQLRIRTNGSVEAFVKTAAGSSFGFITTATGLIGTTQFHHIAYVRTGSTFYLFVDGVQSGTITSGSTQGNGAGNLAIGQNGGGGNSFTGFVDEFRFKVGVADWTSSFTPPTAPYPS